MKVTKSSIAAAIAALLIGGLTIGPAAAAVKENGRVYMKTKAGFNLMGKPAYTNARSAPEGSVPILKSETNGKTNGRKG